MGIKDIDAKTIKPITGDRTQVSCNGVATSSAGAITSSSEENSCNSRQRQRRPDRAVYVPRGRRSQTTPPTSATLNSESATKTLIPDKESVDLISPETILSPSQSINTTEFSPPTSKNINDYEDSLPISKSNNQNSSILVQEVMSPPQSIEPAANMTETNTKIELISLNNSDKDYNEEREFQRASKEINRRNRRIIKQTFDSDVLEINEATKQSLSKTESIEKKPNLPQTEIKSTENSVIQTKLEDKSSDKVAVNTDTDDWESIFDENGDCLDPKLINEITANVGKVTITKTKNDYKSYQEPVSLEEEEFPHVLEVSNFPVEFKTQDLMMTFVEYKDTGFDIKWVDDTHALVVFSSSKIAARALNSPHPFIKLKPLTQATAESRVRAKKSATFLQPYRQRPETCAALARRLVTGALGVRLSTAREEREIERRVLKEAKERKLLAAKLRDEAWEN